MASIDFQPRLQDSPLADVAQQQPGAVFRRADLHVHTPVDKAFAPKPSGSSPEDKTEVARQIVKAARERGVDLIAITEHNDVSWIDLLRAGGRRKEVEILPGFEIESAEGVHVLCVFDPSASVQHLDDTLTRLGLPRDSRGGASSLHFEQLVGRVQDECGGICIAHATQKKGLLTALDAGTARVALWRTPALLAAQLPQPPDKLEGANGRIVRGEDPNYRRPRGLAYVLASDARSPQEIGTKTTWVKMDTLGVAGLRQAFLDPESRLSYHDPAQARTGGRILAAAWEGDFLDDVAFPVNPQLNCLIGGKGTGKSTVIETIRHAFDLRSPVNSVQEASEQLRGHSFRGGSKVSLLVERGGPSGRSRYVVERSGPHAPVVRTEGGEPLPELSPQQVLIPCVYGQKEIYAIAQDARARLELLDGFATEELAGILDREGRLRDELHDNAELLLRTQRRIDDADAKLAELPVLERWREEFRQAGFEELLRERRLLDREQRLLEGADAELRERERSIGETLGAAQGTLEEMLARKEDDPLPNGDLIERGRAILRHADERWVAAVEGLREGVRRAREELAGVRADWQAKRASKEEVFSGALRELQTKMPDVDPERYLDVERRIEQLVPLRDELEVLRSRLTGAQRARDQLLIDLVDVRGAKFRARQAAADHLNAALDGSVRIQLEHQADRSAVLEWLLALKSGAQRQSLERMLSASDFSPVAFAARVRAGELEGVFGLAPAQADALTRSVDEPLLRQLETEEMRDRVEVSLDVAVGEAQRSYRPLDSLSPGQKSTAILLLVMLQSTEPLIIDQPEDDLDNRFIYDDVVRRLREVKRTRQLIISTHNANIPVLGDAEQIIALDARPRGEGERVGGCIRARGSIDATQVRDAAEHILEGGREAFELRQEKYRRP